MTSVTASIGPSLAASSSLRVVDDLGLVFIVEDEHAERELECCERGRGLPRPLDRTLPPPRRAIAGADVRVALPKQGRRAPFGLSRKSSATGFAHLRERVRCL